MDWGYYITKNIVFVNDVGIGGITIDNNKLIVIFIVP